MKKACLCPNIQKKNFTEVTSAYAAELKKHGVKLYMSKELKSVFDIDGIEYLDLDTAFASVDVALLFGGDGTILTYAPLAAKYNVPLLCVNLGTLGYLTELETGETDLLKNVFDADYRIDSRMMLEGQVIREGNTVYELSALNEIVISKGAISKIVNFDVSCNGAPALFYRADGIIASTATGSTAYAMAAGAPIVDPALDMICLCPVCAHTLSLSRPVILNKDSVIETVVHPSYGADVWVNCDGKSGFRLLDGDTVIIKRSELTVKLIRIKSRTFFDTLYKKMIKRG